MKATTEPNALSGMLAAIDQGPTDSVYVMAVENGENIAGMGGLMGTAMHARDFSGAVIDGGTRDVAYLRKIGFPVYSTGIVPPPPWDITNSAARIFRSPATALLCDRATLSPRTLTASS